MTIKSKSRVAVLSLIGAVAITGLAGCAGSAGSDGGGVGDSTYTIGVLVPQENQNAYGASYAANIRREADRLGIDVRLLNSNYTASTQQAQMNQLIAQDVDGIILWPAVDGTTPTMLLAAQREEIPVTVSNSVVSDQEEDLYRAFTGPSDIRVGAQQADIVDRLLDGEGQILVIEGEPGNAASIGRLNGLRDRLAEIAPDITILGTQPGDWLQATAQTATSNLLTRYGSQVDAVVAADDVMAAGAAQAINNAGLTGKVHIVGSGYYEATPPLLRSGEMTATIFQSPCWDATTALDTMMKVLDGHEVDREIFMPMPKVTQENMDEFTPMGCLPEDVSDDGSE